MTIKANSGNSNTDQQGYNIVNALIVSLMIACLGFTVASFVSKVNPDLYVNYLPVLGFLITLERIYSVKRTKRLMVLGRTWMIYQFTQWVFLLIAVKIILLIADHPDSLRIEFQLWRLDFFTYFFDNETLFAIIYLVLVWGISGYFASLLNEMSLKEILIRYEMRTMAPISGPPVRERLLGLIFGLGFIQLVLTGLMRINLRILLSGNFKALSVQPLPFLAAGAWNVLVYFILGLVLMSQSQFTRLNARWRFQQIKVTPQLGNRWATYSILFIVLLAVVASLLPTNYSLGFLSVLAYILRYVFGFMFFLVGFIASLVIFIFNLLLSLLGLTPHDQVSFPSSNFISPSPPVETQAVAIHPWLEVLKSLLFWTVFLGIVGFSVYQFIGQHKELLTTIRRTPGISWLIKVFQWLFGGFRMINQKLSQAVEIGIQRLRKRAIDRLTTEMPRYLSLRRLTPRQRVLFFFKAMVRRGGERGIPRKESQTPYEYASKLEGMIPDADRDVNSLTNAFVEARYSKRNINQEKAGLVKRYWERIRKALHAIRK
ncbi:hypothetical protein AMJ86_06785 [bacterium SM23_57]|jgi:hypothetical protein|nr:MAG: hypothetical protein AMJ86_06785 [bacterium SM23_57]